MMFSSLKSEGGGGSRGLSLLRAHGDSGRQRRLCTTLYRLRSTITYIAPLTYYILMCVAYFSKDRVDVKGIRCHTRLPCINLVALHFLSFLSGLSELIVSQTTYLSINTDTQDMDKDKDKDKQPSFCT